MESEVDRMGMEKIRLIDLYDSYRVGFAIYIRNGKLYMEGRGEGGEAYAESISE